MVLHIRAATAADAAMVAAIYVESSNVAFTAYQAPRALTDERIRRWAADLRAPRSRWWVADADEGISVGFAGFGPSRDPVDASLAELDTIAVAPPQWRRGIGRALMTVVNAELDRAGYRAAILWTFAGYEPGYRFYEAMGWRLDGKSRDGGRQVSFQRPWASPNRISLRAEAFPGG